MPRECMHYIWTYPLSVILAHIKMQCWQLPDWMMPSCPTLRPLARLLLCCFFPQCSLNTCRNQQDGGGLNPHLQWNSNKASYLHREGSARTVLSLHFEGSNTRYEKALSKQASSKPEGSRQNQVPPHPPVHCLCPARWLQEVSGGQDIIPQASPKGREDGFFIADFTSPN